MDNNVDGFMQPAQVLNNNKVPQEIIVDNQGLPEQPIKSISPVISGPHHGMYEEKKSNDNTENTEVKE